MNAKNDRAREGSDNQQEGAKDFNLDEYRPPKGVPRLGTTGRADRVAEALFLIEQDLRSKKYDNPGEAAKQIVAALLARHEKIPYFESQMKRLEPSLRAVDRRDVSTGAELAAVMRIPEVAALFQQVQLHLMGRPAHRSLPAAVMFCNGFLQGRPDNRKYRKQFQDGDPVLGYAFGYPIGAVDQTGRAIRGQQESAFYSTLGEMCNRWDPEMACVVNLHLFRQLAEMTDEHGKLLFEALGRHLSCDGADIECDVRQRPPRGMAHKEWIRQQLRRRGMHDADWRDYETAEVGSFHWKQLWGWKLVILSCLKSTLPLCWKLIPANGDERDALRDMLTLLFTVWPTAPVEHLVGDSFYDHSKDLAKTLVFGYGITPVFHKHGEYSKQLPYTDGDNGTDGVPHCAHGPMKYHQTQGTEFTAEKRVELARRAEQMKKDIAAGRVADTPDNRKIAEWTVPLPADEHRPLTIRFVCPEGKCAGKRTQAASDARVYTRLPRAGTGKPVALRIALSVRRLGAESINALIRHRGLAGKGYDRKAKGSQPQVYWSLSLGLLWQTARQLVHQTGRYDETFAAMRDKGMCDGTDTDRNRNITRSDRDQIRREVGAHWGAERSDGDRVVQLHGYSRESRDRLLVA